MHQAVIAGMMSDNGNHMDDGWWWVMGIGWLIFLGLLALFVWLLVSHSTGRSPSSERGVARQSSEDLLADRFARGEIDADEYRHRLEILREHRSR